jgi:hypothetical protein
VADSDNIQICQPLQQNAPRHLLLLLQLCIAMWISSCPNCALLGNQMRCETQSLDICGAFFAKGPDPAVAVNILVSTERIVATMNQRLIYRCDQLFL